MASNTLVLKHPDSGVLKSAPVGYSWTSLFFGFIPAMLRGDFKWGFINLFGSIVSLGLFGLYLTFTYNKYYITGLMEKGYKPHLAKKYDVDTVLRQLNITAGNAS